MDRFDRAGILKRMQSSGLLRLESACCAFCQEEAGYPTPPVESDCAVFTDGAECFSICAHHLGLTHAVLLVREFRRRMKKK